MRLLPCGDTAVLVEVARLDDVLGLYAQLRDRDLEGVRSLVPASRTLLIEVDTERSSLARVAAAVSELDPSAGAQEGRDEFEIAVVYDGEDLEEVGELTGLGARGVVEAHTGQTWTVAFGGFAPGFAYLAGEDTRLEVPRRAHPRPAVPAGAVGLADRFSGVYPRPSPGGWQLIGRTDLVMWDVDRDPPALLRPGGTVRFVEAR